MKDYLPYNNSCFFTFSGLEKIINFGTDISGVVKKFLKNNLFRSPKIF